MQEYLNEDYDGLQSCFSSYPVLWFGLICFIFAALGFPIIGYFCIVNQINGCNAEIGYNLISVGLCIFLFLFIFMFIPYVLRLVLNCCYKPRRRRTALTSIVWKIEIWFLLSKDLRQKKSRMNKFQLFIASRLEARKSKVRPAKRPNTRPVRLALYLEHKAAGTLKEYVKQRSNRA